MMIDHFKDHAMRVIGDCNSGTQRCAECPLLECCDNDSPLARLLRKLRVPAATIAGMGRRKRRG